jgi:S-adenosylmethionine:tRNA ribosyltransferase-isomerase
LRTSDFDYELPVEYIAQTPVEPRDSSRLLILWRNSGRIEHSKFKEIGRYLRRGDVLVVNETRVIPARLLGWKIPSGGKIELLLLRNVGPDSWEALVGGKGFKVGQRIQIEGRDGLLDLRAEITHVLDGARRLVRFDRSLQTVLDQIGYTPLPPYIHTPLSDPDRYQTVYARQSGSAAAPTAGLHFTPQLIEQLHSLGVRFTQLTLHVGLDTFAPVHEEFPQEHLIHTEWCQISRETARTINQAYQDGGRVVAVGTTSVRALETAARVDGLQSGEVIAPYEGRTDLFILPGFEFRAVDAMVTNFHLPRSTLIMLVSAFAGRQLVLGAYEIAKQEKYRFYSFGDAMLIL